MPTGYAREAPRSPLEVHGHGIAASVPIHGSDWDRIAELAKQRDQLEASVDDLEAQLGRIERSAHPRYVETVIGAGDLGGRTIEADRTGTPLRYGVVRSAWTGGRL